MPAILESLGLDKLPRDQRLALAQALWDSIAAEGPHLTEAQKKELDRRIADDDANPDGGIPWEQVKAKGRAEFKQ